MIGTLLVRLSVTPGFRLSLETTFVKECYGFKLSLGCIASISVSVTSELRQFQLSGKHNKIAVSAI